MQNSGQIMPRECEVAFRPNVGNRRSRSTRPTSSRARNRLTFAGTSRARRIGAWPVRRQQRSDIGRGLRRAEQVALHFRTAERTQQFVRRADCSVRRNREGLTSRC